MYGIILPLVDKQEQPIDLSRGGPALNFATNDNSLRFRLNSVFIGGNINPGFNLNFRPRVYIEPGIYLNLSICIQRSNLSSAEVIIGATISNSHVITPDQIFHAMLNIGYSGFNSS